MESKLLIPWAIDQNGKNIGIEHAQKGQSYFCPKCGEPLSYCKSGTGPHARRNHFKHKADTNCVGYYTPHETESYIHKTAKEGIYRILHSYLENGQSFPILWTCPNCRHQYDGNLLNGVSDVKMENVVDSARSDVALLNEHGDEIVAIEIVYKHDVELRALNIYEDKNITVVRLCFYSVEDLNDLEKKLHNPDSVNICLNVKCINCQTSHLPRHIIPLQNQEGKNAAVAVAIVNPFDGNQQPIWGLPFSLQDQQNAVDFVRRTWPNSQIDLELSEQSGIHFAMFITPNPKQIQVQYPRQVNPFGTGLDKELHERKVKAIRKSYAQKSSKKTSSKNVSRKRR